MVKIQVTQLEDRIVLPVEGRLAGPFVPEFAKRVEPCNCQTAWLLQQGCGDW